jgi:putative tryptophan/tyrosine transport system substrate-binding protein
MLDLRRRHFLTLLGGAAAAWPLAARAQQSKTPVIGYLHSLGRSNPPEVVEAFLGGLQEAGFVDGHNVAIEYRFAEGRFERLPDMAADLVRRRVDVLATSGGSPSVLAAKAATTTIPIVFMTGDIDPVQAGIVASLSRPGGNITGVSLLGGFLGPKRLEILREIVPGSAVVAVLVNPSNRNAEPDVKEVEGAVRAAGLKLVVTRATANTEFEPVFATLVQQHVDALIVTADPIFTNRRADLTALTAAHRIPAIYQWPDFVKVGGLVSYGTTLTEASRQVGTYVGRVLKGARPADLPVTQPTKFHLVVNLKAAKALGLEIPPTLLARADEVIE